jgi:hypothetical protein
MNVVLILDLTHYGNKTLSPRESRQQSLKTFAPLNCNLDLHTRDAFHNHGGPQHR